MARSVNAQAIHVAEAVSLAGRAPAILFGGVFLLLGAIGLFIGGGIFLQEQRYQQQGTRAPAVTTDKALRLATSDSSTSYELSYRVTPAEGSPFDQTENADVHLWERVERGSPLVVEYVPGKPETARVVRDRSVQKVIAIAVFGVGVVFALIGLVVVFKGARSHQHPGDTASVSADAATVSAAPPSAAVVAGEGSFWSLARRSFGFWFGGTFLLFGLSFFIIGITLFYNDWRFAQEARPAQGIVLTKEFSISRGSSSTGSGTPTQTKHYAATYRFTAEGKPFEGRDELSYDEWQQLVEREPVEVLYRPGRPTSSHLAAHNTWFLDTLFTLLGFGLAALGGTFFVRAVRNARLEWRLRRNGVSTQGTVTELRARNLRINNVQQWRLDYEYRDFQERRHSKTITIPGDEAQLWKVGDAGGVLYDSAQPTEAVWLGRKP